MEDWRDLDLRLVVLGLVVALGYEIAVGLLCVVWSNRLVALDRHDLIPRALWDNATAGLLLAAAGSGILGRGLRFGAFGTAVTAIAGLALIAPIWFLVVAFPFGGLMGNPF